MSTPGPAKGVSPLGGTPVEDPVDRAPSAEALRAELVRVHDELTRLVEQDEAAAGSLEALGVDVPGGLAAVVEDHLVAVRRELGRTYRDLRRHRFAPAVAVRRSLNTLLRHGVQAPRDGLREYGRLRREARGRTLAGAGPLLMSPVELDSERARIWLSVLEERYADDPRRTRYLQELRQLSVPAGQISTTLETSARLASGGGRVANALADVNGRMAELSGWVPRIPGPVTPVKGGAGVILHLVKESRPYLSNGFTSRSHWNLLAEREAGWTPVVLTEPGFPQGLVAGTPDPVEVVDGIEHRRLLTGVDYAKVPADRWMEDFAQLALPHVLELRPDVIHVSSGRRGYETALVALALRAKTGVPVVYEVRSFFEGTWTSDLALEEDAELFRRRFEVERRCMLAADRVLTLGTSMRDELVARGVPAGKIDIVPNGVRLDQFVPGPRDEAVAARFGISMPTFGYVSNMDHPREGQELLIEAARILRDRGRRVQCVLVGGGRREKELRSLAAEAGLGERVVFTGAVDHGDVAALYAQIDVFVVPRIKERAARYVTPLKPFEAMAMRRPVLVSDLPALREVVSPPERGRVFPSEDAVALADEVEALLDDPAERERLAAAGRAWVEAERQWSHNAARYNAAYRAVLAEHGPGDGEED